MKQFFLFALIFISWNQISLAQDHWRHVPSPYYMKSISQADSNHLVVAGGNEQKIFKSNNSGDSFTEIYSLENGEISDIAHPNPALMLAIVDSVRNIKIQENPIEYQTLYASYILRSTDSGKTWTPTYFSQTGGSDARVFRQIIISDDKNGIISQQWADTNKTDTLSPILYTQDGGLTWKESPFPTNNFVVKRDYRYQYNDFRKYVSSPKPGVWFVAGYNFKDDKNEVWRTSDYGQTWKKGNYPLQFLNKIQFVNDSVGFAIGSRGNGFNVVSKTLNGGLSWTDHEIENSSDVVDIDFYDEDNGIIADAKAVYRTGNSGATWTTEYVGLVDSIGYVGDPLRLISYYNRNHAIGITRMQNLIRYVPEGIAEQPRMTTPKIVAPIGAFTDKFPMPGRMWWTAVPDAVRYYVEIYTGWMPQGLPVFSNSTIENSILINTLSEPFFGNVRVRAITANSVSNWSVPVPFSVFKTVSVQDESTKNINPYPNPANNIIYIPFKTTNESEISVMICDALGKSINTFKSSYTLSHNAIMLSDLEQLPNGIYFVQISQGNQQQTSMITISK